MLSFDAPYEGKIFQQKGNNIISITLNELIYDSLVEKSINSPIVQDIIIDALDNATIITFKSSNSMAVYASKTQDGFGLRIRIKPMAPPISVAKPLAKKQHSNELIDMRYISVIGVLFLCILFLYFLKSKLKAANSSVQKKGKPKSWLFKQEFSDEVQIISQKILDNQNKVVLLKYQNCQYLVLTGATNVILDRFGNNGENLDLQNESEFQTIFEQNRQKLDNYLKLQQANKIKNYKEKASQDFLVR